MTEVKKADAIPFFSVTFFDSLNGIGITSLSVEKTSNGGKTWETTFQNVEMGLYSLNFPNQQNGWIVGTESKIIPSENNGENSVAGPKNSKPLILKTEDRGLNWQKVNIDEESLVKGEKRFSAFFDVCFDKSGKIWLVGDGGVIEGAIDNQTLKVLNVFPTEVILHGVSCNQSGEIWAVGDDGIVLHYQNGNWNRQSIGIDTFFNRVKIVGNEIWIVGASRPKLVQPNEEIHIKGVLFRSRDNGQTWEEKTPASADGLSDIYLNGKRGWLVGMKGGIYSTNDGGNSWVKEKSPTENDLLNIFFLDSNNGWISGDKTTILEYQN